MQEDDSNLSKLLTIDLHTYFPALVRAYSQKLYSCAFYIVRSRLSAEDIVQESFFKAYKALKSTPSEEILSMKLGSWLIKIVYHQSLNYKRDGKYQHHSFSLDLPEIRTLVEETNAGQCPSPEAEVEDKEVYDELHACVNQLSYFLRITFILHYEGGLSYPEIAEVLEQPLNTVKSNGRRGVLKLQEMLARKKLVD